MKQIRKKIKLVLHYIPSGDYDKKDKAFLFIRCNDKKTEIHLEKKANKTDLTMNDVLNEIRKLLDGDINE